MKRFILLMLVVCLIFTLTGCQYVNQTVTIITEDVSSGTSQTFKQGNTDGNNRNGGLAAMQDDWIYYKSPSGLYKIKTDGTGSAQLYEGSLQEICVYNEWVYFRETRSCDYYRIRTDGTGLELFLPMESCFYYVNDYIYYVDYETKYLYRMRPDKSEKTLLIAQNVGLDVIIAEDAIYWCNLNDMYIANLDGTNIRHYDNVYSQHMLVYKGHRYTCGNLEKSDISGNNKQILVEKYVQNINISDDWIYFTYGKSFDEDYMYKIRTDGTELTKLNDVATGGLCVVGDWIYYYTLKSGRNEGSYGPGRYYKMRIDGSENTELL